MGQAFGDLAGAVRPGVLRDLGWAGFVQVVTFFLILSVGYVYVWRKGVLDWGPAARQSRGRSDQKAA